MLALLTLFGAGARADDRLGVLVVATVPALEAQAGQIQGALEEGLGRSRSVVHWGELQPPEPAAAEALQKLRAITESSLVSCAGQVAAAEGSKADEAVALLTAASPVASPQDVQRAYAVLAAQRWILNQSGEAEAAALLALAIDSAMAPPQVVAQPGFHEMWDRARFAARDKSRSALEVESSPPGARILVDATFRGFTPASVPGLSQGAHLLQIERVGFRTMGAILSLTGAGAVQSVHLVPVPGWNQLQIIGAAQAAQRGTAAPSAEIAQRYQLGYLVLGVLSPRSSGATLALIAVRARDRKLLGSQALALEGDEYGQAGRNACAAATSLLEGKTSASHAESTSHSSAKDPLDAHDGTEDW